MAYLHVHAALCCSGTLCRHVVPVHAWLSKCIPFIQVIAPVVSTVSVNRLPHMCSHKICSITPDNLLCVTTEEKNKTFQSLNGNWIAMGIQATRNKDGGGLYDMWGAEGGAVFECIYRWRVHARRTESPCQFVCLLPLWDQIEAGRFSASLDSWSLSRSPLSLLESRLSSSCLLLRGRLASLLLRPSSLVSAAAAAVCRSGAPMCR